MLFIGHALRNAFIPVLTYLGILFGLMLGTAPVTETVFTWPGVGYLYISAIQQLDYPVIMGVSMIITIMLVDSDPSDRHRLRADRSADPAGVSPMSLTAAGQGHPGLGRQRTAKAGPATGHVAPGLASVPAQHDRDAGAWLSSAW